MLYGKGRGNIESVVYGIVPQPCRKARINGDLDVEAIPWRAAWVVEEEGKDRRDGSWIASDIAGRQRQLIRSVTLVKRSRIDKLAGQNCVSDGMRAFVNAEQTDRSTASVFSHCNGGIRRKNSRYSLSIGRAAADFG